MGEGAVCVPQHCGEPASLLPCSQTGSLHRGRESKVSLHGSAASSLPRYETMLLHLLIISFCHAISPGFRVLKAGTKGVCELWGSDLTALTPIAIPLLGKILKLLLSKGAVALVLVLPHFEQRCHESPVQMGKSTGACSHCGPLKIDMTRRGPKKPCAKHPSASHSTSSTFL